VLKCAESEGKLAGYKVMIDDNYHYQDENERVTHGLFGTADEAVAACQQTVDECLESCCRPA
jgi:hypothetical protein